MAAEASGHAPPGGAAEVLRRHAQLLGWQMASERASFALKVLTGVVGLAAAIAVVVLIYTSSRHQGLVVQAFSAPPDLVARGLTGEVLAGDLMDRLVAMQEDTDSVRAPNSYAIDWSDGTEVEIPQTGVSIGELRRYLRSWLGNETRISGVVYRRRDGQLAVTARTGGTAGQTFIGPEEELDGLMRQAAESVYARTQPYRYTVYLRDQDRAAEAEPIWRTADQYGEPESLWIVRGWGIHLRLNGDPHGALEKFRWVQERAPAMGPLYQTIADAEAVLGRAEASYQARLRSGRLIARSPDVDPARREDYAAEEAALLALVRHDVREVERGIGRGTARTGLCEFELMRWDLAAAERDLAERASTPDQASMTEYDGARLSLAREDFANALARLDETAALMNPLTAALLRTPVTGPTRIDALIGLGRAVEARSFAASLPNDCYFCVIGRAKAAEALGDRAAADRDFARADAMAPSLADAPYQWARALLARGDTAGAIRRLTEARRRAPGWPDPLKVWGDALLARGDAGGAIRKYKAAAELAPRWGALNVAWARALDRQGRRDQAAARYRFARGLVLTDADRAEVDRRLGASNPSPPAPAAPAP